MFTQMNACNKLSVTSAIHEGRLSSGKLGKAAANWLSYIGFLNQMKAEAQAKRVYERALIVVDPKD